MAWLIESISVAGGFLGDLVLELPKKPALICVIGPRGSGKSTLVEALRFAFAGLTNATRARQDLVQANLGHAVVTVTTAGDPNSPSYVINRRYRQEPSLATRDGRAVTNIDLDRGSFLPLERQRRGGADRRSGGRYHSRHGEAEAACALHGDTATGENETCAEGVAKAERTEAEAGDRRGRAERGDAAPRSDGARRSARTRAR